jgi:flagellar hook-associated protein 3 FlgL
VSSSRITSSMTSRMVLSDLQDVANRLAKTQQKISSGKDLTVPSDDPFRTNRSLQLRSELEAYKQYETNIGEASAWQSVTDTALSQIGDYALRARDLLVQGASDTMTTDGREALASEIDQLVESVKSEGNTQYAGRFVFAGTSTTTQPYQQGAVDTYAGTSGAINREIGRGVRVQINADASAIGDGSSGLIGTLRKIAADLRTPGSTATLGGADLQALDAAHDAIVNARAVSGALSNRLDSAKNRLGALEETTNKLLSENEDADMAQTLVDYSQQQAVYQAALKAGAQLIQPSLLDFLR